MVGSAGLFPALAEIPATKVKMLLNPKAAKTRIKINAPGLVIFCPKKKIKSKVVKSPTRVRYKKL